jgi:hypothetical protein
MNTHLSRPFLGLLPLFVFIIAAMTPAFCRGETSAPRETPEAVCIVNVFGAVNKPGAYRLPAQPSLLDAIAAAGSVKPDAKSERIAIVRGPAGERAAVTFHDFDQILRGKEANPKLQDRDSIFVDKKLF